MKHLNRCLKHGAASEPFTVSDSRFVYVLNTQHAPGPVCACAHTRCRLFQIPRGGAAPVILMRTHKPTILPTASDLIPALSLACRAVLSPVPSGAERGTSGLSLCGAPSSASAAGTLTTSQTICNTSKLLCTLLRHPSPLTLLHLGHGSCHLQKYCVICFLIVCSICLSC